MAFECPACHRANLEIVERVELGWHHFGRLLDAAGEDALRSWFAEPAEQRCKIDHVHELATVTSDFPMRWIDG